MCTGHLGPPAFDTECKNNTVKITVDEKSPVTLVTFVRCLFPEFLPQFLHMHVSASSVEAGSNLSIYPSSVCFSWYRDSSMG